MRFAAIKDNICINWYVCDDETQAKQLFDSGAMGDADSYAVLPDGFGIGDTYEDQAWEKAVVPVAPEPDLATRVNAIMSEIVAG